MTELKRSIALHSSKIIAISVAIVASLWIASGVLAEKMPKSKEQRQIINHKSKELRFVRVKSINAEPYKSELQVYGRTEAVKYSELSAETSGRVVQRHIKKGTWAEKGQVVIQLAIEDRRVKLNEAEALVNYQTIAHNAAKRLSHPEDYDPGPNQRLCRDHIG